MNEIYVQLIKYLLDVNKVDRKQVWSMVNEHQLEWI